MGSVISHYFDLGFPGFIVTWYASNLIGGTLFWWFTARELRRRDIHGALRPRLFNVARRIEGAWNFVWTTNIAHTIWAAQLLHHRAGGRGAPDRPPPGCSRSP